MRRAIRVYAIVALVALGVFLAVWWASPFGVTSLRSWSVMLNLVEGAQLWVLLVIPLGVLAGGDAAHIGRRSWLSIFIALIVLAPIAAQIEPLTNNVQYLLAPSCSSGPCALDPGDLAQLLFWPSWAGALLLIPLAALLYTVTSTRIASHTPADASGAPGAPGAGRSERHLIAVCAVIGLVVMSVLGYLANSDFILMRFGSGTLGHILYVGQLQIVLRTVWFTLLNALPVTVASLAMMHAARAGRHGWLAGWIAVVVLAMLAANLFALVAAVQDFSAAASSQGGSIAFQQQIQDASIVTPVVVLLAALLYALTTMRPRQRTVALAGA